MKPRFRKVPSRNWAAVIGNRVDWKAFSRLSREQMRAGWLRCAVDGRRAVMRSSDDVWFVEVAQ